MSDIEETTQDFMKDNTGARKPPQCSKCGASVKGHPKPIGEGCQLISAVTAQPTVAPPSPSVSATMANNMEDNEQVLLEAIQKMQAEKAKQDKQLRILKLKEELEKLKMEVAANSTSIQSQQLGSLQAHTAGTVTSAHNAVRSPLPVTPSRETPQVRVPTPLPATQSPTHHTTLRDLRQMEHLNNTVDEILASSGGVAGDILQQVDKGKLLPTLKSPRDAPYNARIVKHVYWPHQFIHRVAQTDPKYDNLSEQEFVLGTAKILQLQSLPQVEKTSRLKHLEILMALRRTYTWQSVRLLYGAVLEELQFGHRDWQQSFHDLQEIMLHPCDVVTHNRRQTTPANNITLEAREICKAWNFKDKCPNGATCHRLHKCYTCHRYYNQDMQDHKSNDCPRRAEYLAKNGKAAV